MKTNDYLLIAATAAYSFLFHGQNAGLNFLIFSLLFILFILIRNKELLKDIKWLAASSMVVFSSICIVMHSSALAIFANIVSLIVLSGLSFNTKTSYLFNFLFGLLSLFLSFVFVIIDTVKRQANITVNSTNSKNYKWLGIIVVSMVAILFFILYKNSNPLFAEYTKWINLDFITVQWLAFTTGGFFLTYALLYHKTVPFIERWENNLGIAILPGQTDVSREPRLSTEKVSLILLFTLLNLMLLVINIGDVNTILLDGQLPKGIKHSDFVHNGISALIFSIIFAISIIMYFLRGDLNFYKGNRFFKILVLVWIVQNIIMLLSTAWRNNLYISEYTLTYKRIGVYVWLALAFIGLILTAVKVRFNRSNWFLVKTNFAGWIMVLALSSSVDWDLTIARYNLQNKKISEIDYYYLFSLSDTAIPELITFCQQRVKTETVPPSKSIIRGKTFYQYPYDYMNLLHDKIESYAHNYTPDLRSWDQRDERILKALQLK